MNHIDKVEHTIEHREHDISNTQVDQEVVGDSPHASVGCNTDIQTPLDEIDLFGHVVGLYQGRSS